MIGRTLNSRYKITELVGHGGMANVYKALDLNLNKYVAVKVLKKENSTQENSRKNFLMEARADAKLNHPNIVNVYDVGIDDGEYYIVMDYIEGDTLKKLINIKKQLSAEETVQLLIPIADGLSHAHRMGLIHRDIKPHNILMTADKSPRIADFGIARAVSEKPETATEEALGSVHYISPEQARGGYVDQRSDLYSLGVMMYEMLTGEVPYDGDSPVGIALMHVQNNVPNPQLKMRYLPKGVCQVVLNLTRRKPDDRYQSADELNEDLMILANNINAEIRPTFKGSDTEYGLAESEEVNFFGEAKYKKLLKYLIPSLAALIVVGTLVLGTISKSRTVVPTLTGLSLNEAITELKQAGLDYAIAERVADSNIKKDHVVNQSPLGETEVKKGGVVYLTLSNGPKVSTIPNVVGYGESAAESMLNEANFSVKDILYYYNDDFAMGKVYAQTPEAFTQAKEGTEVTLYVSKGRQTVLMPKLTDLTLDEAIAEISQAGLTLGSVNKKASNYYAEGKIMEQTPTAFIQVEADSVVNLTVSLGAEKTKTFNLNLKDFFNDKRDVLVEIYLCDAEGNNPQKVYEAEHKTTDEVAYRLTGTGIMTYKVYFDSVHSVAASGVVEF